MTPREQAQEAEDQILAAERRIADAKLDIQDWQRRLGEARRALALGFEDKWPEGMDKYELFNRDTGHTDVLYEKDCIRIFGPREWEEIKAAGGNGQFLVNKQVDEPKF